MGDKPRLDHPDWRLNGEHETGDGTWIQRWSIVDCDGHTHEHEVTAVARRARTDTPPR